MSQDTVSVKLVSKMMLAFLVIIFLVGLGYMSITLYFTNKYFEETSQKLNAEVANHLIEEKFQDKSPFLDSGQVNKALFGDIMHDMMAVNRRIEVYLLSEEGAVLYSVVLDHSEGAEPIDKVSLAPIQDFIACNGNRYILGDDPRNPGVQKIFSAAPFEIDGNKGYIYIILAGKQFEEVTNSLISSYFIRMGLGASVATLILGSLLGLLAIWYLTRSLRGIIDTVRRFKEGDLTARIEHPEEKDLSLLSETFNSMADTINANIDNLKSVEALRRELIANVSHDLRTPLAITQGYVETLQMKQGTLAKEDQEKYLAIIQKSVEKLSGLIAQLFEYSKLEAKQIEPQKEPFPIAELAQEVVEKYQTLAEKKSISIHLDVEQKLPSVFADISLVERVIQNLMDNALKFTPEGGRVTMGITSDNKNVFVSIKDTGKGIPASEVTQIFERFKQASSASKSTQEGAGLGLAIAKKIMEIHDSTIQVMSKPNVGTTFQFHLPLASS